MNKQINSAILGPLMADIHFPNTWKSKPVEIPFFDNAGQRSIIYDFDPELDKTFLQEADEAVQNFLNLTLPIKMPILSGPITIA